MFRRIILDHWMAIFPLVSFITAASVYATMFYLTVRWKRGQVERFADLPFNDEQQVTHESR